MATRRRPLTPEEKAARERERAIKRAYNRAKRFAKKIKRTYKDLQRLTRAPRVRIPRGRVSRSTRVKPFRVDAFMRTYHSPFPAPAWKPPPPHPVPGTAARGSAASRGTFIQQSREVSSELKAFYNDQTRPFIGLSEDDEQALWTHLHDLIQRRLETR